MVVQNSQINRGHFCKNGHKNDCAALACIPDSLPHGNVISGTVIEPGESKVVTLSVSKADLEFYDEKLGRFVCEPGWFTVQIGTSSRDLPLSTRMRAIGKNPYAFGADTQFSTIAKHPQARHELLRHLGPDILNEQELRKRTAYISFSYTLRDAWEQDLRPLAADASDADQRFEALCCALSEIDVTDLRNAYRETEIF